jgi:predicted MPP superfamily phosphohydrolase
LVATQWTFERKQCRDVWMLDMKPIIDPRDGDLEDDASSTKRRSMLSLAGSLFAEISLAKLFLSWTMLFILPGLLLGLTPLIASAWLSLVSGKIAYLLVGIWPALLLLMLAAVGLFGARSLFRIAESSFWSLNSLAIEPVYTACREGMRHLAETLFRSRITKSRLAAFRAVSAVAAGILMFGAAAIVVMLAWPNSRWLGNILVLTSLHNLATVALANSAVLVAAYFGVAALVWAFADATMPPLRDFDEFLAGPHAGRTWRIAHLSDIHFVGERYGFRIESGRSGPRGNGRLSRLFALLDVIHSSKPLDLVLVTGDVTDAGRSAEWSEFRSLAAAYPRLAERVLILPGNHDLNIVDRANPARLDLPTSPNRTLRRLRFLSAADAFQSGRVRVVDYGRGRLAGSLSEVLKQHRTEMTKFADVGRPWLSKTLNELWAAVFPMVLPPDQDDGLGIMLLNSNADTHFSFTNALGMIPAEQVRGIEIVAAQYPKARWIIALHHHVIEYPRPAKVLSERIGTALVNGNWFVRRLQVLGGRAVLMHGHRHIDWIGECAGLPIVSAPSPVMEVTNEVDTYLYVHTLAVRSDGQLSLMSPERIVVNGETA